MRHRYLRPSLSLPEIYLYRAPVDFRKQAQGLAVLVEQELGHNPFTGALYAFTNRHRNKIKCLMWEDNGFVLYYKSLAEEKFKWPKASDELMSLTGMVISEFVCQSQILVVFVFAQPFSSHPVVRPRP